MGGEKVARFESGGKERRRVGMLGTTIMMVLAGALFWVLKKYLWPKVFYTRESLVAALRREREERAT